MMWLYPTKNLFHLLVNLVLVLHPCSTTGQHQEVLDELGKVRLQWESNPDTKELVFELEVETRGWVGFGISPQGSMVGADIFVAGVNDDGSVYYSDRHATSFSTPLIDKHQDWTLLEGTETLVGDAVVTRLKFSRLANTCDVEGDYIIDNGTARVIYAYGEADHVSQHGSDSRGVRSMNLVGEPTPDFNKERLLSHKMFTNMTMPSISTSYWCTYHRGPNLSEKHHVVAFDKWLPSHFGRRHVHHMTLYNCPASEGGEETFEPLLWPGYGGGDCNNPPEGMIFCSEFSFVWTIGAKPTVFPDNVGYPIGGSGGRNTQMYYMLEIHYDNTQSVEGLQFDAGMEIFYTKDLRAQEAAMLTLGHSISPELTVPPQEASYKVVGHCSSECTDWGIGKEGITVFNSLLHAHTAARHIRLRWFRGSEEFEWIDDDKQFDFNYQQNKHIANTQIMPGDQLAVECIYSSKEHHDGKAAVGGWGSRDEMCQAYLWYYPKQKLEVCESKLPLQILLDDFNITEWSMSLTPLGEDLQIEKPLNLKGRYRDTIHKSEKWNSPDFRRYFQQSRVEGVHTGSCQQWTTGDFKEVNVTYPNNMTVWKARDTCPMNNYSTKVFPSFIVFLMALPLIFNVVTMY